MWFREYFQLIHPLEMLFAELIRLIFAKEKFKNEKNIFKIDKNLQANIEAMGNFKKIIFGSRFIVVRALFFFFLFDSFIVFKVFILFCCVGGMRENGFIMSFQFLFFQCTF